MRERSPKKLCEVNPTEEIGNLSNLHELFGKTKMNYFYQKFDYDLSAPASIRPLNHKKVKLNITTHLKIQNYNSGRRKKTKLQNITT